jgi:molybdate transport system substrate-binding protein
MISRTSLLIVGLVLAVPVILYWMPKSESKSSVDAGSSIMVYCAASNQAVIEKIAKAYNQEYGRNVQLTYGSSQSLLSQLEVSGVGDVFLPADDSYLAMALEKNLVDEILPIASMQAVVAVKRGNPKSIQSLNDLLRSDVRLVQASPDGAAIGKITRDTLQALGSWDTLDKTTTAFRGTVNEVANDVVIGSADAGIVYDAVLHTYPQLEFIQIPELKSAVSKVAVGIVSRTKVPQASLHFARYVAASDRGLKHYSEHGFQIENGDQWSDVPELKLFAGSMLRPAIEDTIVEFEQREGVKVNRVYNGCGILVAQMQAGQHPDAYFACDSEFMKQVSDLFPSPVSVSQNELVILVEKGNPHQIQSLRDLGREGIRVGIGHEKQCAMGWITQNTLRDGRVQKEVMANVTVQTPTGDMLVNQLKAGSLDAAVAYLSNAAGSGDVLDAIPITGIECSTATQPWAIAEDSQYPNAASRLFERLTDVKSKEIFTAEGFRWNLGQQE